MVEGAFFSKFSTLIMSLLEPENNNLHGSSKPACDRFAEYLRGPVISQSIVPPLVINKLQTGDIKRGTCPTTFSSSTTATA